jgi:uncharacterized membrane protein YcaP (DUF421 family)
MNFIWEALIILLVGFCLMRIAGKRTVGEMSGMEIITLLSIASVIAHAVSEEGFWETTITLCLFVVLLITVQYLAIKFNLIEKLLVGKSTTVIQDGKIILKNLNKLRLSVDQLEAKLREKGISSFSDVKTATIEFSGHLGYELMRHAKPVTIGELEKMIAQLRIEQER